jgi:hypothetical protein
MSVCCTVRATMRRTLLNFVVHRVSRTNDAFRFTCFLQKWSSWQLVTTSVRCNDIMVSCGDIYELQFPLPRSHTEACWTKLPDSLLTMHCVKFVIWFLFLVNLKYEHDAGIVWFISSWWVAPGIYCKLALTSLLRGHQSCWLHSLVAWNISYGNIPWLIQSCIWQRINNKLAS